MRNDPKKFAENLFHEMLEKQGRGNTLYGCPEMRAKAQAKVVIELLTKEMLKSLSSFVNLDLGRRLIDEGLAYYDEALRILNDNEF